MTRQIFIDCDGVLADFDAGFRAYFGPDPAPEELEKALGVDRFWYELARIPAFYRNLPLMPRAEKVMALLQRARPIILTGCPRGGWAEAQKLRWAEQHFPGVPMVCTFARSKATFCRPGDVLIDDRTHYRKQWEAAGGTFIQYTTFDQLAIDIQPLRLWDA